MSVLRAVGGGGPELSALLVAQPMETVDSPLTVELVVPTSLLLVRTSGRLAKASSLCFEGILLTSWGPKVYFEIVAIPC